MVPLKRRRIVSPSQSSTHSHAKNDSDKVVKFPQVVLFIVERKMGSSRRAFLSQLGRSKGFQVEELYSESVSHIISENNSVEEVRTWLEGEKGEQVDHGRPPVQLLDISWYTECMQEGHPVEILDRHRLQDALSILADSAEFNKDDGRGVAFRRAAAVLKFLPKPVTGMEQLRGLPCLGGHSLRVIKEILENGVSSEVEATRQSERYKAMKVLTGIFGVGVKTADRWFREGIQTLSQLQRRGYTLNQAQQAGLKYYDELNQPVTKAEADAIGKIVEKAVLAMLPGAEITLTGGFRRGKLTGHDVDFLITHPEEGKEEGLLHKVVSRLESQGFLVYQKTTRNSYLESKDGPGRPSSNMDRFERCFLIFKLTEDSCGGQTQGTEQPKKQMQTDNGLQTHARTNLNTAQETRSRSVFSLDAPVQSNGESLEVLCPATEPDLQLRPHPLSLTHPSEPSLCVHAQVDSLKADRTDSEPKPRRAVRVDLVVSPKSQFAFALLGWTGSKLFERDLRRWAGHEKAMSLSSHALYDSKQKRYLRASSEEEIFAHLGLDYIPPSERNA
ncbi:DNA-directed DNA/RNA polymerase mu isoform 2-T2 [Polymixia lowei]